MGALPIGSGLCGMAPKFPPLLAQAALKSMRQPGYFTRYLDRNLKIDAFFRGIKGLFQNPQ